MIRMWWFGENVVGDDRAEIRSCLWNYGVLEKEEIKGSFEMGILRERERERGGGGGGLGF